MKQLTRTQIVELFFPFIILVETFFSLFFYSVFTNPCSRPADRLSTFWNPLGLPPVGFEYYTVEPASCSFYPHRLFYPTIWMLIVTVIALCVYLCVKNIMQLTKQK